jgi:hypothetical protein
MLLEFLGETGAGERIRAACTKAAEASTPNSTTELGDRVAELL